MRAHASGNIDPSRSPARIRSRPCPTTGQALESAVLRWLASCSHFASNNAQCPASEVPSASLRSSITIAFMLTKPNGRRRLRDLLRRLGPASSPAQQTTTRAELPRTRRPGALRIFASVDCCFHAAADGGDPDHQRAHRLCHAAWAGGEYRGERTRAGCCLRSSACSSSRTPSTSRPTWPRWPKRCGCSSADRRTSTRSPSGCSPWLLQVFLPYHSYVRLAQMADARTAVLRRARLHS